jgi:hypothetical protein
VFSRSSFGGTLGLARELYSSNFKYLPGYPGCSVSFRNGSGFDRSADVYYGYQVADRWTLRLNGGFHSVTSNMLTEEGTSINIDGVATPARIEHTIDATLNQLMVGPSIGYDILPGMSVTLGGNIRFLLSPSFSMKESLVEPVDRGVFVENGLRTRNEHTGVLPLANSVQTSVDLGARYLLPMNQRKTLSLVPSATFRLGATNIVKGLPWKENGIRGALSVEYRPEITEEPPTPVPPPPVVKPDTLPRLPRIFASVTSSGVTKGVEEHAALLRVEEIYETRLVPIVPYVFFDRNSSSLSDRYRQIRAEDREAFHTSSLMQSPTLDIYHDVLNILGSRLREYAAAHIIVTGCTDGDAENTTVAAARSQSVKD